MKSIYRSINEASAADCLDHQGSGWNWSKILPKGTAVLLCAHGSRDKGAVQECERYVDMLKNRVDVPLTHGYLEFARPVIGESLKRAFSDPMVRRVVALPMMLLSAGHVKNDIPSVLRQWASENGREVVYGAPVGLTPTVLALGVSRLRATLQAHDLEPQDCALVTVGRGTSDPDANSDVFKLARMLTEGLGLGWTEVCYSGVTFPSVPAGLERVSRMGFRNVLVYEHFLFQGVLIDRIRAAIADARVRYPHINWLDAGYLGCEEETLALMQESLLETHGGVANMNCQLCKYRAHIPGFEQDVGQEQQSHHHHVEGIGVDEADNTHHHTHAHHHHAPYTWSDHPLGKNWRPG